MRGPLPRGAGTEQYINEVAMIASSTFIAPQKVMIEVLLYPDQSGNSVTPAYFNVEVTKFMLNRKLIALESYFNKDVKKSPVSVGIDVVTDVQFRACALTLLREPGNGVPGGDFYKNVPLEKFRRTIIGNTNVGSAPELWRCEPTGVSWSDSYIMVGTNFAIQGDKPVSALFLATYLLPEQDPEPYRLIRLKHR